MKQKNILLITADDLFSVQEHREAFGIRIRTPNLDRLAGSGARFDHAYAPISVCGPSRAATFTGLSPFQTGILDNQIDWKEVLRPAHAWQYRLRQAGYWTATQGKIFHGHSAQPQIVYEELYDNLPFDITVQPTRQHAHTDFGGLFGGLGFHENEDMFYDTQVIDLAINCLDKRPSDRPFYIEAGLHHPHAAFNNPVRFFEDIELDEIIRPEAWDRGWEMLPFSEQFTSSDTEWKDPSSWEEDQVVLWKKTVRNYIASIHFFDYSVGRLLDALDERGLVEETIVCLFSDHGYHLADRARWHKMTAYEQAALAPLIIKDPDAAPVIVKQPVSLIDIGPTLLTYAGLDVPPSFVGEPLCGLVEGKSQYDRAVPSFWFGSASVRIQERRLILWQDGSSEHYDVMADPWQQRPMRDHPKFADDRDRLLEISAKWGLKFVEQGLDISTPSPFVSFLGKQAGDVKAAASGAVAMGDITNRAQPPGYHTLWALPHDQTERITLPPHISCFMAAMRGSSLPMTFKITGNKRDNYINVTLAEVDLIEADLGDGDDDFRATRSPVLVYGGSGNDRIRGGRFNDVIFGGSGNDRIGGGPGDDVIYGGSGNDVLRGGPGNDTIWSGHGRNKIFGDGGRNHIVLNAGSNVVQIGPGPDLIELRRTGRHQVIKGFNGKQRFDVSDFMKSGALELFQEGKNVLITANRERIVIENSTKNAINDAILGC